MGPIRSRSLEKEKPSIIPGKQTLGILGAAVGIGAAIVIGTAAAASHYSEFEGVRKENCKTSSEEIRKKLKDNIYKDHEDVMDDFKSLVTSCARIYSMDHDGDSLLLIETMAREIRLRATPQSLF